MTLFAQAMGIKGSSSGQKGPSMEQKESTEAQKGPSPEQIASSLAQKGASVGMGVPTMDAPVPVTGS